AAPGDECNFAADVLHSPTSAAGASGKSPLATQGWQLRLSCRDVAQRRAGGPSRGSELLRARSRRSLIGRADERGGEWHTAPMQSLRLSLPALLFVVGVMAIAACTAAAA